jgi:hypothetical protein
MEAPSAKPAEAAAPQRVAKPVRTSAGASVLGLDAEPQPSRPAAPAVSGLSFLGLGGEPADTNYLLEDERRGHAGLWITLVLLVAAGVAGWHYKAELRPRAGQVYAAVLQRVNPQPSAPAASVTNPVSPEPTAAGTQASAPAAAPDAASQPAGAPTSPSKPEETLIPAASEKSAEAAKSDPDAVEDLGPKKNTERAAKYARASRPQAAEEVAPEDDPVLRLAQKYIHGQGVRRDCTTGIAYLRQAMKRPNSAAASQMGALYATGTCVPLDRVAAYRYFTAALQMAPGNPWLGQERDKLYGQMSSAERRQADRQ